MLKINKSILLNITSAVAMLFIITLISVNLKPVKVETVPTQTALQTCTLPGTGNPNDERTTWNLSCTLTKFDPSLGTLLSISLTIATTIRTDAELENQDAQPINVTITRGAEVDLQRPDLTSLISFVPTVSNTENFSAYDGITDYAGTSGVSYGQSSTTDSDSRNLTNVDPDFALFLGTGPSQTIVLPVNATSVLTYSSLTANFASIVNTFASAVVTIQYTYEPVVVPQSVPPVNIPLHRTGGADW